MRTPPTFAPHDWQTLSQYCMPLVLRRTKGIKVIGMQLLDNTARYGNIEACSTMSWAVIQRLSGPIQYWELMLIWLLVSYFDQSRSSRAAVADCK